MAKKKKNIEKDDMEYGYEKFLKDMGISHKNDSNSDYYTENQIKDLVEQGFVKYGNSSIELLKRRITNKASSFMDDKTASKKNQEAIGDINTYVSNAVDAYVKEIEDVLSSVGITGIGTPEQREAAIKTKNLISKDLNGDSFNDVEKSLGIEIGSIEKEVNNWIKDVKEDNNITFDEAKKQVNDYLVNQDKALDLVKNKIMPLAEKINKANGSKIKNKKAIENLAAEKIASAYETRNNKTQKIIDTFNNTIRFNEDIDAIKNNKLEKLLNSRAKANGTLISAIPRGRAKKPVGVKAPVTPKDFSKNIYYKGKNNEDLRPAEIQRYLRQFRDDDDLLNTDMVKSVTKAMSGRNGGKGSHREAAPLIDMAKRKPYTMDSRIDKVIKNFANLHDKDGNAIPYDYQIERDEKSGTFILDFFPDIKDKNGKSITQNKIDSRSMIKIPLSMLNKKGHLTLYGQENTNIPILDFGEENENHARKAHFENSVENLLSFAAEGTNFDPNHTFDKRYMQNSLLYNYLTKAYKNYQKGDNASIEEGRKALLRARDSLDKSLGDHKVGSEVLSNYQGLSEDFRKATQGVGSVESSSIGEGYSYLGYGLNKLITPELRTAYRKWYKETHSKPNWVQVEKNGRLYWEQHGSKQLEFNGDDEQINKNIVHDMINNVLSPYMTGILSEKNSDVLAQHLIEKNMGYFSNDYLSEAGRDKNGEKYNLFGEGGKLFGQTDKGLAGTLHSFARDLQRAGITVDTGQESQFDNALLSMVSNADLSVSANAVDLTNNKIKKVLATSPRTESSIWNMFEHKNLKPSEVTNEYKRYIAEKEFKSNHTYKTVGKNDLKDLKSYYLSLDAKGRKYFDENGLLSDVDEKYIKEEKKEALREQEIKRIMEANEANGIYNDVNTWGLTEEGKNNHLIPSLSMRKTFTPFEIANGHANDENIAGNVFYREQRFTIQEENEIKDRMIKRLMGEMLENNKEGLTEDQIYQRALKRVGNVGAQEGGIYVNKRVQGTTAGQLYRTASKISVEDIGDTYKKTRDRMRKDALREWKKKYGSDDVWGEDALLTDEEKIEEGIKLLYGPKGDKAKDLSRKGFDLATKRNYQRALIEKTFQNVIAGNKGINPNSINIGNPEGHFDVNDIFGDANRDIFAGYRGLVDEDGRINQRKLINFLNEDHTGDKREMSLQFFENKVSEDAQKLLGMDVKGSAYYADPIFFEEFAKYRAEELANRDASQGKFKKNSKKYKDALESYKNELSKTDILTYQEGVNGRNFGPSFITYMDEVYDRTSRKTNTNGETDLDRLLGVMGITPDAEERKKGRYVFNEFFKRDESNLRGNIEKLNTFLNENGYDDIADVYKYNKDGNLDLDNLKWAGRTFLSPSALPGYGSPGKANVRSDYRLQDSYVREPDMNGALSQAEKEALISFDLGEVEFAEGTGQFGSSYRVKEGGKYGRMNGVNNAKHIEDLQKYWKEFNEISRTNELTYGDKKVVDPFGNGQYGLELAEDGTPVVRNGIAYMGDIDEFMQSKAAQDILEGYDDKTKEKFKQALAPNFVNLRGTLDFESDNKLDYGIYNGKGDNNGQQYIKKYVDNGYQYMWRDTGEVIKDSKILNEIDPMARMFQVMRKLGSNGEMNFISNASELDENGETWGGTSKVGKNISNNHITLPVRAFIDSTMETDENGKLTGKFKNSPFSAYLSGIFSSERGMDEWLKRWKSGENFYNKDSFGGNKEALKKANADYVKERAEIYKESEFNDYKDFLNAYINKDESEMDKVKSTAIYNSAYVNPIAPTLAKYRTGYENFSWTDASRKKHKVNTGKNASKMDKAIRDKFDNSIIYSSRGSVNGKETMYGNAEKLLMNQGNINDNDYITSLEKQYEYMYGNLYNKGDIKKQLSDIASKDKSSYAYNLRQHLIKSSTFGENEFNERLALAAKKGVDFRGLLADSLRYPLSSGYDAKKFDLFFNKDWDADSALVGLGLAGDYNMDWDGDKVGIFLDLFRNDWKDVKNIDDLLPAKVKQKEAQQRTANAVAYEMRKKYTKDMVDVQTMDPGKYGSIFDAQSQATGAILSKLLKSKTGLTSNRYQAIMQSLTGAKRKIVNPHNIKENEATTYGTAAVFESLTQDAISAKKVIERVNAGRIQKAIAAGKDPKSIDLIKNDTDYVFTPGDLTDIDTYLSGYDKIMEKLQDPETFKNKAALKKVFADAQNMGIFGADGEEFFSDRVTAKLKSSLQNLYTDSKGFVDKEGLANAYGILRGEKDENIDKYIYHYKPIKNKKGEIVGYTNELDKEEQNKHLITVKDKDKDGKEITKQIMAPITSDMAAHFLLKSDKLLQAADYGNIAKVQKYGRGVVPGTQSVVGKPYDFIGSKIANKDLTPEEVAEGMKYIQNSGPSNKLMGDEINAVLDKRNGVNTLETGSYVSGTAGSVAGRGVSPESAALSEAETENITQRIGLLGNEKGVIESLTLAVSNLSKIAEHFAKQYGFGNGGGSNNPNNPNGPGPGGPGGGGPGGPGGPNNPPNNPTNPFDSNPNKPDNSYLDGARTSVLLDDRFGGFKNKYAKDTFEDQVKRMYNGILLGDYSNGKKAALMNDFLQNSYGSSDDKINRLNFRADLAKLHTVTNGKLYDSTHQFIDDVNHWTNGKYELGWDKFSDYDKFKNDIFDKNYKNNYLDNTDSSMEDYFYNKETGKIKSRKLSLREAMQRSLTSSGLTGLNTHGGGEGIEFLRGNMSNDEIENYIKSDIRSQIYQRRAEAEKDLLKNNNGSLDNSKQAINFNFNHQKMQTVDVNPNNVSYEDLDKEIDRITKLRMQDYGYNKAFSVVSKNPLLKFASQAGGELPTYMAAITGGITANKVLKQFHDYQYAKYDYDPSEWAGSEKFTNHSLGAENNFVTSFDGFNVNGRSDVIMKAPGANGEEALWLLDKKYPGHNSLRYAAQMYTYSKGLENVFSGMSKEEKTNFLNETNYNDFIDKFEKSELFGNYRGMFGKEGDKIHGSDVIGEKLFEALKANPDSPIYNGIVGNENGKGYIDRLIMDDETKRLMDKRLNKQTNWLEERELNNRIKNSWHRDYVSQINNPEAYDEANQYIEDLDAQIKEYNDKRVLVKKYRSDIKALKKEAKDAGGTANTTEQEKALAGVTQEGELARSKVRGTFGKVFQMKDGAFVLDEFGKRKLTDFGKQISQQQVEILNGKADKYMSAQSGMYGGAADVIIDGIQESGKTPKKQGFGEKLGNMGRGLVSMVPFYHLMRIFGKVTQELKQLDSTLANLRIVTGDNREEATKMISSYSDLASSLGRTTTEVSNSAIEWQRQGYNAIETMDLIKSSMYLSTLGMLDASTATKDLTKMLLML